MDEASAAKRGKRQPARASGKKPAGAGKSQQRWAAILQMATQLFRKRGFYATSMQDISDAVGVKKASLYYYVKSKEDLLFEILRDVHKGGEALIEGANLNSADPLGELRSLLIQMGIYAHKHADRLHIFSNDFDYLNAEQKNLIISERRLYWHAVVNLIASAIARGQVSPSLDVGTAAHAALRTTAAISEWFRPDGPLAVEQVAVQNAVMIVQGLAHYERG